MTELVTMPEANRFMLIFLFAAPIVGLVWGLAAKELVRGLVFGLVLGVGNYILWTVYNAITDSLGLDTVKNLLVNLGLFIAVGVVAGILVGRYNARHAQQKSTEKTD